MTQSLVMSVAIDGLFSPHTDRGVSAAAKVVRNQIDEVRQKMSETETLGRKYREALEALQESYAECARDNWNGYGAKAATTANLFIAVRLLGTLPPSLPTPEISVDPDGEFAFEWYKGRSNVLSVSINQTGKLSYAASIGRKTFHGTDFFADEFPKSISENLERLFSE
jgi:hypothetical protein